MHIGEQEYLIEQLPSFYDYMGYMYYCGCTIAGPFFEYKDFINFINRTGHYIEIPKTYIPTLIKFSQAICKLEYIHKFVVFIILNSVFGDIFFPEYLLTEAYANESFLYKIFYSVCTLKLKIYTYFTAFLLMETAVISSGLAFDGFDENSK